MSFTKLITFMSALFLFLELLDPSTAFVRERRATKRRLTNASVQMQADVHVKAVQPEARWQREAPTNPGIQRLDIQHVRARQLFPELTPFETLPPRHVPIHRRVDPGGDLAVS